MSAEAKITQPTPTLLVVADDSDLKFATVKTLEQAGYTVLQTATAAEALALTHAHQPALVLLDVRLVDGGSREVARQLKTDPALTGVFVVLMSGAEVSPADQALGLNEGLADGYILRSVPRQVLRGWVEVYLRLRATQMELRKQEEKCRVLFETLPLGVTISDPTGRIIETNSAAEYFRYLNR